MDAITLTIDRINQKRLKNQLINAILTRKAIIQANEGIIEVYSDHLAQAKAAGADCSYLSEILEDLRSSKRTAESELLQFQNTLHQIGE